MSTDQLSPIDTTGWPVWARIAWFMGFPVMFAVWLLYYVLYVQPIQATALQNLTNVLAQHEKEQVERTNDIIRALNYDQAILRAVCLALMPYRNKEEALKCQPIFLREFELPK